MIEVVILGTGNVASHLFRAMKEAPGIEVRQVYNHSDKSLQAFEEEVETTTDIRHLHKADLYLLALKDDVISEIASLIPHRDALVVHTSGSADMEVLGKGRTGVFYPLQTFSKEQRLQYRDIPFCLEAGRLEDLDLLKDLAGKISGNFYEIGSLERKRLHLAAVFVCNFVNHLYAIGEEICTQYQVPFEILHPLIRETTNKVMKNAPVQVQTGPAVRDDKTTIQAHLDLLEHTVHQDLYQVLTRSIQSFYGKKL